MVKMQETATRVIAASVTISPSVRRDLCDARRRASFTRGLQRNQILLPLSVVPNEFTGTGRITENISNRAKIRYFSLDSPGMSEIRETGPYKFRTSRIDNSRIDLSSFPFRVQFNLFSQSEHFIREIARARLAASAEISVAAARPSETAPLGC